MNIGRRCFSRDMEFDKGKQRINMMKICYIHV